ncbi:SRPBCC domain-containing protein [Christiangramia sediminis]|uniref:SRPBCC domain-containing protein n=1 Tax=Christiangramia sediminis TaxID=2881336 RepID=A0A9X1LKX4_9FLAO|nr:SRPBCC domain-containing protein [Christiangramia sediminis]MCB7482233.1 SRPBCC domain-containing protein [Christiangramia sediminis]
MQELEITTSLQISKPITEVYEAIVDPAKMSKYFIAQGSERMQEGKSVEWTFPEFPDMIIKVKIIRLKSPELIIFEWEGSKGISLEVNIRLEGRPENTTLVRVSEGKMKDSEEGIIWLKRNTEGWANFLACLKAYLEYDINLRKGAFDFMRNN